MSPLAWLKAPEMLRVWRSLLGMSKSYFVFFHKEPSACKAKRHDRVMNLVRVMYRLRSSACARDRKRAPTASGCYATASGTTMKVCAGHKYLISLHAQKFVHESALSRTCVHFRALSCTFMHFHALFCTFHAFCQRQINVLACMKVHTSARKCAKASSVKVGVSARKCTLAHFRAL